MKILLVMWKWFLIANAVALGTALLNLYRPTIGLGDVVFFLVAAVWISKGITKDLIAQAKRND